jgi:hypothetical protein
MNVSQLIEDAKDFTVTPTLSNYQKWAIALGTVTTEKNLQPENQLSLFDPDSTIGDTDIQMILIKDMLSRDWGINSTGSALQIISYLVNEGHSYQYLDFYKQILRYPELKSEQLIDKIVEDTAFRPEGKLILSEIERVQQIDAFDYVRKNMNSTGNNLIYAWDYGRAVYVIRASYTAGYINDKEALLLIEEVGKRVKTRFASWDEFAENYAVGRKWWGINDPRISEETDMMMINANIFWSGVPWDWSNSEQ